MESLAIEVQLCFVWRTRLKSVSYTGLFWKANRAIDLGTRRWKELENVGKEIQRDVGLYTKFQPSCVF